MQAAQPLLLKSVNIVKRAFHIWGEVRKVALKTR